VTLSLRARLGPPLVACALAVLPCCGRGGALAASDAVRRSERVAVDGAELFLETRGADRRAPLLLWLHGGPGGAERPLFRYFNGDLEEHFVVAYWDQRGAGRSYDPEADPRRLTIARHLADLDLVVEHLRRSLGREKVVLIGHSWGTALGLLYSRAHPEKVSAFLGVAQVVSTREGQRAEHEFVAVEARRRGDAEAVERIREIGPPPYETATELLAIERLCERYGGVFHRAPSRAWVVIRAVLGGLVTPWEIPRFVRGNDVSLAAMHEELASLDLRRSVPEVAVPVFFLLGRHDRHVEAKLAARYFEALQAPVKRLIWFEDSAHNPPFEEPEAFDAAVVSALASIGVQAP
jgi:pimeloyl-ACP methyl ester carboxylesterase